MAMTKQTRRATEKEYLKTLNDIREVSFLQGYAEALYRIKNSRHNKSLDGTVKNIWVGVGDIDNDPKHPSVTVTAAYDSITHKLEERMLKIENGAKNAKEA